VGERGKKRRGRVVRGRPLVDWWGWGSSSITPGQGSKLNLSRSSNLGSGTMRKWGGANYACNGVLCFTIKWELQEGRVEGIPWQSLRSKRKENCGVGY